MKSILLPPPSSQRSVEIPDEWLGEVVSVPQVPPAKESNRLFQSALDKPIGSSRLEEIAWHQARSKDGRVAVVVDDITRQTPLALMLPPLLERLGKAGIRDNDIYIVIALGSHRPMTTAEISRKLGSQIASNYTIVNTPSSANSEMVFKGISASGIPAWINQAVAEADLRIGLGMITPHMDAGFSGGSKIILPGVCSTQSVDVFHARAATYLKNPLGEVNAPLRMDLERFVAENIPLDFIFNAILNTDNQVYRCVSGHPIDAHRAGATVARRAYGAHARRRYPIVLACCYPYEHDLWQSMKGLWCGDLITADGGRLILLTQATEGNPGYPLLPNYIGSAPDDLKRALDSGQTEDPKAAATGILVGHIKRRIGISLVSEGISKEEAGIMGMQHYPDAETAIEAAIASLPEDQRQGAIGVLTHAGVLLPLPDRAESRVG